MKYTQLDPTYRDDVIAQAMYARELEYFHYEFDAINFRHLLTITPAGPALKDIQDRLDATLVQMQAVENVYAALQAQITDTTAHAQAVARAIEKRKATTP